MHNLERFAALVPVDHCPGWDNPADNFSSIGISSQRIGNKLDLHAWRTRLVHWPVIVSDIRSQEIICQRNVL